MAKKATGKPIYYPLETSVEGSEMGRGAKIALYGFFYGAPAVAIIVGLVAMIMRD